MDDSEDANPGVPLDASPLTGPPNLLHSQGTTGTLGIWHAHASAVTPSSHTSSSLTQYLALSLYYPRLTTTGYTPRMPCATGVP